MAARKKTTKAPVPAAAPTRGWRGKTREGAFFPVFPPRAGLPRNYAETLSAIKQRIQQERLRVVVAANSAMVLLYWDIGRMILDRQQREGWGARVIDRLAADLREGYPDMKGFSARNLLFMRSFAEACPDAEKVKQLVSRLPGGPRHPPPAAGEGARNPRVVHPGVHRARLEQEHPRVADRRPRPRTPWQGPNQLQGHTAARGFGHGRAGV